MKLLEEENKIINLFYQFISASKATVLDHVFLYDPLE